MQTVTKEFMLDKAKEYCKHHDLSYDKLVELELQTGDPIGFFVKYKNIESNGLYDDEKTRPYWALAVEIDGNIVEGPDIHLIEKD